MSEKFQNILRSVREQKSMSQSKLGEKAGLQPAAISHFENGRRAPSFSNLRKLADALSVSIDYLLGREEEPAAAGPKVEAIFRHIQSMSSADQDLLTKMAENLADRNAEKTGGGDDQNS